MNKGFQRVGDRLIEKMMFFVRRGCEFHFQMPHKVSCVGKEVNGRSGMDSRMEIIR